MGCGGGGSQKVKPTAQEKALAEVSAKQYNDYQQRFRPLTAKLVDSVRTTAGERESLAGSAHADAAIAFEGAEGIAQRNLAAGGVRSGSGRSISALSDISRSRASASGKAQVAADRGATENEITGLSKMTSVGRGIADTAVLGMSSAARNKVASAITEARSAVESRQAIMEGIGTGAGMAFRYGQGDNTA